MAPALLEMMDRVEQVLASRGDSPTLQKLIFLREQAEQVLELKLRGVQRKAYDFPTGIVIFTIFV